VQASGLGTRVVRNGAVDDVRPYLHAADVFVLPSEREGLSNSLLEALACGVPCIAPPSAGGDQLLDDSCGIVPPDGEPTALHGALRALAEDPDRRARLAEGAAVRAQRFSLARVALDVEALVERLAERPIAIRPRTK
jgi:glycosyltransferase involved in cell wall biosynthesis